MFSSFLHIYRESYKYILYLFQLAVSQLPATPMLYCCVCKKTFKQIRLLFVHLLFNHYSSTCDICLETFTNLKIMAKHKYDVHSVQSLYDDSDNEIGAFENDAQHQSLNEYDFAYHEDVWVECGLCTDMFCNIKILKNHRESEHKKKQIAVPIETVRYITNNVHVKDGFSCELENSEEIDVYIPMFDNQPDNDDIDDEVDVYIPVPSNSNDSTPPESEITMNDKLSKLVDEDLLNEMEVSDQIDVYIPIDSIATERDFRKKLEKMNDFDEIDVSIVAETGTTDPPQKIFDCPVCFHPFAELHSLIKHQQKKHNNNTFEAFQCDLCSNRYKKYNELKSHITNVHVKQLYKCNKCTIIFCTAEAINKHHIIKHNLAPYQCNICFKSANTSRNLRSHRKYVHSDSPDKVEQFRSILTCNVCLKTVDCIETLANHRIDGKLCRVQETQADDRSVAKTFKCGICLFERRCYSTLKRHIVDVHIENRFQCMQCGQMWNARGTLTKHIRNHHNLYNCDKCEQGFVGYAAFRRHKAVCDQPLFRCDICQLQLKNAGTLQSHIRYMHNKLYVCDICGKKFGKLLYLSEHIDVHINARSFLCDICSKRFNKKLSLVKHMDCHQNKCTKCVVCAKTFLNGNNLGRHMLLHKNKRYACTKCSKSYSQSYGLKLHMREHDGLPRYKHKCDKCDRRFLTPALLTSHRCCRRRKRFDCKMCPELLVLRSALALEQHQETQHPGVSFEKPIKKEYRAKRVLCQICNKVMSENNLQKHMRVHTGEKPFQCECCSKRFTQKCQISSHMFVHTRDSKHVCNVCGQKFPRSIDLKRHANRKHLAATE